MSDRVAFVASNDTHVDLFSPVMTELEQRGVPTLLGSLDSIYNQGVTARAAALGRPTTMIAPELAVSSVFYRRRALAIWRDVLRTRRPVDLWLRENSPRVVVMGNDRGLVEKLVIHTAHRQGRRVLLVQDGTLVSTPRPASLHGRLYLMAKRTGSAVLRAAGMSYLSASQYGQGGADLLCASGPHGAERFRQLGVDGDRIAVTGQPRFDALRVPVATSGRDKAVIMFTTPFAHAGIGVDLQQRQTELVTDLSRAFSTRGVPFRVKPHPRETIAPYLEAVPDPSAVMTGRSADALRECSVAIIGASTVLDEAGLIGVPVVVPGDVIHAGRLDDLLPPADMYPRFEDAREAVELACVLLDDALERATLLRRQHEAVAARVFVDPGRSAASLIADAACSLVP